MPSLQAAADAMYTACEVWSLGYDQNNRWDIRDGGECDCSSLVSWCLQQGDLPIGGWDEDGDAYTGNEIRDLTDAGWYTIIPNGDLPELGDVLWRDGHTALCIGDGQMGQASIDEHGNATGGESGDQGDETNIRDVNPDKWTYYLRYGGDASEDTGTDDEEDTGMECIYQPNEENYMVYYDGSKIHPLAYSDEVTAINMVYQQCHNGKNIPIFALGQKNAPWATRFSDAASR